MRAGKVLIQCIYCLLKVTIVSDWCQLQRMSVGNLTGQVLPTQFIEEGIEISIVVGLDDFGEKLLLTHKYGANGLLDALRHATDMERGVIRSLRAGLLTFEKHGAIAAY